MTTKKIIGFMAAVYSLFILITVISFSSDMKSNSGNTAFAMGKTYTRSFTIDQTAAIVPETDSDILIESVIAEVNVKFEQRIDIQAHAYGEIKTNSENEPELIAEKNGNTIRIYLKMKYHNSNLNGKLTYDVAIPLSFKNSLKIHNVSGNTFLSGDNIKLKNIGLENVSGDITINNAECLEFKANSVSGDISISSLSAEKSRLSIVSGDIDAVDFKSPTKADSVSGDIEIQISSLQHDYSIETVSGSIDMSMPENSEFILKSNSVSGDIECPDFAIKVSKKSRTSLYGNTGNGGNTLEFSTVSGDINIEEMNDLYN